MKKILPLVLLAFVLFGFLAEIKTANVVRASASLGISSATLASNGQTITVNISGVTGPLSPSSGVTGFNVRTTNNEAAYYPIASTSVSGNVLSIILQASIPSDDTVLLDVSGSSNLTDGSSNTMSTSTGNSVANNSSLSVSRYTATNPAITSYGQAAPYVGNPSYFLTPAQVTQVFVVNGTDAYASVLANTNTSFEVSVDGSGFATTTLVPNENFITPLFSGLAAGDHVVAIKNVDHTGNNYYVTSDFLQVLGGTGAIRAFTTNDTADYGPVLDFASTSTAPYLDYGLLQLQTGAGDFLTGSSSSYYLTGNGESTADESFHFRGKGNSLKIFTDEQDHEYAWYIDGVKQGEFTTSPENPYEDVYTISNSLDGKEHLFSIQYVQALGTHGESNDFISGVMLTGAGAQFYPMSPLPGLGGYGDSITQGDAGTGGDSSLSYISMLANSQEYTPYNEGRGGTTVQGGGGGASSTALITGISPELTKTFVMYGTNDIGCNSPTPTFGNSYQIMLNNLLASTTNEKFYVIGILPRSTCVDTNSVPGNYGPNGVQGSVQAVIANTPSYANRLYYIDPTNYELAGESGADYSTNYLDGIHPNARGYQDIYPFLLPFAASTSPITITGPSSGLLGATSANFTASLMPGALFDGNSTITISDGSNGGTFTSSLATTTTSSIAIIPTASSTSFTFTYTPSSVGTKTITFSNGQLWSNPASVAYTVTSSDNGPVSAGGGAAYVSPIPAGYVAPITTTSTTTASSTSQTATTTVSVMIPQSDPGCRAGFLFSIATGHLCSSSASTPMPNVSGQGASAQYAFLKNLSYHMENPDVLKLQQYLAARGFFAAAPNSIFGPLTLKALIAFQAAKGIKPASGYFGPLTRAYVNSH